MSTELIINASLPETRIALQENGEIQELLIERASGKGIVGNIYKGRVTRVLPGMQAAFIDIGLEKAAFLYVDDVYVHSDLWETDEDVEGELSSPTHPERGEAETAVAGTEATASGKMVISPVKILTRSSTADAAAHSPEGGVNVSPSAEGVDVDALHEQAAAEFHSTGMAGGASETISDSDEAYELDDEESAQGLQGLDDEEEAEEEDPEEAEDVEDDEEEEEGEDDESDDHGPVEMGQGPDEGGNDQPSGTIGPSEQTEGGAEKGAEKLAAGPEGEAAQARDGARRRRRGRRGGRSRRDGRPGADAPVPVARVSGGGPILPVDSAERQRAQSGEGDVPESLHSQLSETGEVLASDRADMSAQRGHVEGEVESEVEGEAGRPDANRGSRGAARSGSAAPSARKNEFNQPRSRDRRIRPKQSSRPSRGSVNIQDLLKEGQEVIVQVAKDPIATKGARLTCHLSLPGRHLVCMPTIDHVGVSRRIERDDERRKLREYVERYRPKNLGFIVRTASGKNNSEQRIKQDIEYLTRIWTEIREKAGSVAAPALVYEDLNSVLRAIRDWVTDEIDKIVVDSRYHYNEILRFVSHFMPSLKQKVELYHGDVPVFDAYNISTELSRALERKVWLKSGGYLVIDQAEALVAIDVNTGRFVGKKNLEDTILKTNLEAVLEIAYQLRIRNCGGIIILDLIDMEKEENKQRVYRALEEALKKDRARPSILKISELGLVEMTRKRTRDTMVRALCESCSHCEGKGFIKSKQTVAYEILREVEREGIERNVTKVLVQAHPDVVDILAIDERETMDQLERRYRKQIYLQAIADFHAEQFEVSGDKQEGARPQPSAERGREPREGREERGGRRDRGGRERGRGRDRQQQQRGGSDRTRDSSGEGRRPQALQTPGQPSLGIIQPLSGADTEIPRKPIQRVEGELRSPPQGEPGMPMQSLESGEEAQEGRPPGGPGDEFEEEDRLAFLRAQAAQDAALAKLRGAQAGPETGRPQRAAGVAVGRSSAGGAGPGRPDRDGRAGRRGRRGRRGRVEGEQPRAPSSPPRPLSAGNGHSVHREAAEGELRSPTRTGEASSSSSVVETATPPSSGKPDQQTPV